MNTAISAAGPTIGIVTVLFNSDDVLDGFFASLALQSDISYRLYVIDNGATTSGIDLSRKLAQQYGVDAEFLFNNANLGVAKGNNQGIEMALRDHCEYVLLANNDTEFNAGTLRLLADSLTEPNEAVATPAIYYYGTDALVWYAGGAINRWTLRTPHFGILKPDPAGRRYPRHTEYAPTCFMLLRADVFAKVGLMDEAYFVYYDDTDFGWRLIQEGYRIRLVSDAIVQHKVSTSTGGGMSPFSIFYTNRNRIYFARKNLSGINKLFTLGYILCTRLTWHIRLSSALRERMWAGVKAGFGLNPTGKPR